MAQEFRQPIVTTVPGSSAQPLISNPTPPAPPKLVQFTAQIDELTVERMGKAAQLAFRLGIIKEPTIDALLKLWIDWGFNGLRGIAMERAGFR